MRRLLKFTYLESGKLPSRVKHADRDLIVCHRATVFRAEPSEIRAVEVISSRGMPREDPVVATMILPMYSASTARTKKSRKNIAAESREVEVHPAATPGRAILAIAT
jgi:hypothetical protein